MATIERALEIAVQAHKGFKDKSGQPYILHPLRIMHKMRSDDARIVAILHDVVEDSVPPHRWGFEELRAEGFAEHILEALDRVTRRETETYEEFVERSAGSALSMEVKLGDLEDNMDLRRNRAVTERDVERMKRYLKAWHRLTSGKAPEAEA
ncbi:GTP pyrophosphokinase [Verrucomicrobia bacterium LW23]|nr:GTP pyrophosphokinase [Verrucomicrobia bacterium LW23]